MTREKIWEDDQLGRQKEAELLQKYLLKMAEKKTHAHGQKSFVLNLKGDWGSGKTYFLERFEQQLKADKYLVARVDMWRVDPETDPLTSIILAIYDALDDFIEEKPMLQKAWDGVSTNAAQIVKPVLWGILKKLAVRNIGAVADDLMDEIENPHVEQFTESFKDSAVESVESFKPTLDVDTSFKKSLKDSARKRQAIDGFVAAFSKLTKCLEEDFERQLPIFIVIDELDRCRPDFAIRVLERINHIFDIENVVFIIGSDSDQLAHSIKAVYGSEFDSREYLNRFFTRTYHLKTPSLQQVFTSKVGLYLPAEIERYNPIPGKKKFEVMGEVISTGCSTARQVHQTLALLEGFFVFWHPRVPIDEIYLSICALSVLYEVDDIFQIGRSVEADSSSLMKRLSDKTLVLNPMRSSTRVDLLHYSAEFSAAGNKEISQLYNETSAAVPSRISDLAYLEANINIDTEKGVPSWAKYRATFKSLSVDFD